MERLQEAGISTRPGTHAVHMLGFYARIKYNILPQGFSRGSNLQMTNPSLSLLHNRMVKEDFEYIVHCLKNIG